MPFKKTSMVHPPSGPTGIYPSVERSKGSLGPEITGFLAKGTTEMSYDCGNVNALAPL